MESSFDFSYTNFSFSEPVKPKLKVDTFVKEYPSISDYGDIFEDIIDDYLHSLDHQNGKLGYTSKITKNRAMPTQKLTRKTSWWRSVRQHFSKLNYPEDASTHLKSLFDESTVNPKTLPEVKLPKKRVTIKEECEIIYPSLDYDSKRRRLSRKISHFKTHR